MDFAAKTPFRKSNTSFFAAKKTARSGGKTNSALDEAIMAARAGAEVPTTSANSNNSNSQLDSLLGGNSSGNNFDDKSSGYTSTKTSQSAGSDLESIFGAANTPRSTTSSTSINSNATAKSAASASTANAATHADADRPRSAQEIINARYGKSTPSANAGASPSQPVASARDAINAAKRQAARKFASDSGNSKPTTIAPPAETAKSASKLHHGFIQRSMESTRASASALLKNSKGEKPNTPAVRTSLKLGADALPTKPVATLPPNARMARAARPVDKQGNIIVKQAKRAKKILTPSARRAKQLAQRSIEAQTSAPRSIPINGTTPAGKPKQRSIAISDGSSQITVTDASNNKNVKNIKGVNSINGTSRTANHPAKTPSQTRSSARSQAPGLEHPQAQPLPQNSKTPAGSERPLIGGRSVAQPNAAPQVAGAASGTHIIKGSATNQPLAARRLQPAASPNRPNPRPAAPELDGLGVVEDYAAPDSRRPAEASETSTPGLNARDPKNPKAHKAEDNRRTLGKQSPFFLKSVNVEKRPLSHETAGIAAVSGPRRAASYSPTASYAAAAPAEKPSKAKFGNIRSRGRKKSLDAGPGDDFLAPMQQNLPERPTVIVPSSRRSSAPLFFLVLLTVILGAAVGAAAYLCFFQ